ncbi:VWA domain-containing protein, partial [Flavobacterium sp. TSSA_36]|uniref:VWA domain-containing protein n=1 Tax=Flavobacterium sp. TSSA_36 TaxID=3447669 RepID=UPI003F36A56B
MKKKLLSTRNFIRSTNAYLLIVVLTMLTNVVFGQTITPVKTVTTSTNNCGILDVQLKFTGANPATRDADVVLVIDVSGSMNNTIAGDTKKSMQYAKDAAKSFIDAASSNPNNRIAIVSYTTNAKLESGFLSLNATNITALKAKIDNLTATSSTNIQDGIVVASKELNTNGRFDCTTARSIILLTDGVATRTGPSTNLVSCNTAIVTSQCVTEAITAANAARTTIKSSVTYNNQIFSVGLFGGISGNINTVGSERYVAKFTLDGIQGSPAAITNTGSDLTTIYNNIATQITWVAQSLVETETIPSGYTISGLNTTKGTAAISGQQINWSIDFLNSETITLNYKLTPASSICGNQVAGSSTLSYKNSTCNSATLPITTPTAFISCPTLILNSQVNVTCFGSSSGSINLNDATGGSAPYTYDWADVTGTDNPKNRTELPAGTYSVTAKDKNGCATATLNVTITQPAAALALAVSSKTDAACFGASTGSVTAGVVTGGVGTITYSWKNASNAVVGTTASVSGLPAGTYTVTVSDSCSSQSNSVTIGQPAAALALAVSSKTDAACFGASTGSVTAGVVTGAVGTVSYSWKNASNAVVGTTASVSGLPAGTYTVTVSDTCSSQSNSVTIGQPVAALALAISSKTDAACFGASTGTVTAGTVTGAVGTVTYSWKNASNAVVGTTASVSGLPAGTYTVTVSDSCSTLSNSVTIGQPAAALALAVSSKTDAACFGASTGSVTAGVVTGG